MDFLKGYLILCILFTHSCQAWDSLRDYSLYCLWGCAPTGCFMLVSSMHFYRKGIEDVRISLWKHIIKVILPFLILQILVITACLLFKPDYHLSSTKLISLVKSGGYGVGSYFPWVYIQYLILMMILTPIIRRINNRMVMLSFFLLISISIEILCSVFDINDGLYRILVLRFPFLIYLGLILDQEGLFLSNKRILLSLIGLAFILLFEYGQFNMEPFFYNTSWKPYHWICYPYLAFFLIYYVYLLFRKTNGGRLSKYVMRIGKASYGIFLFQAIWFMLPLCVWDSRVGAILYMLLSISICTICGVVLKERIMDYCFK